MESFSKFQFQKNHIVVSFLITFAFAVSYCLFYKGLLFLLGKFYQPSVMVISIKTSTYYDNDVLERIAFLILFVGVAVLPLLKYKLTDVMKFDKVNKWFSVLWCVYFLAYLLISLIPIGVIFDFGKTIDMSISSGFSLIGQGRTLFAPCLLLHRFFQSGRGNLVNENILTYDWFSALIS